MKNQTILPEKNIILESGCRSKDEVIAYAAELVLGDCSGRAKEKLKQEIWERERLAYTGIGSHIALVHAESVTVDCPVTACIRLKKYIDWAPGKAYPPLHKMVKLVVVLAVPKEEGPETEVLKDMVRKLGKKETVDRLMRAEQSREIIGIFQ